MNESRSTKIEQHFFSGEPKTFDVLITKKKNPLETLSNQDLIPTA